MQSNWYAHLKTEEEREEFKKFVLGSSKVLDRLRDMCYNVINNGDSVLDYDSPNWAVRQADRNGYLRAYREILKLTKLD